jgi:hypothetical protein
MDIAIQIDQRVQLMHDIPDLELHHGDAGIVCSTWFAPLTAYEVEFERGLPLCCVRVLLMPNQITANTQLPALSASGGGR